METLIEPKSKLYTYNDYLAIADDKRYELLDGGLFMVPAPSTFHQNITENLGFILSSFVKKNRMGKVFYAPTDVILADNTAIQPDILFVSKERKIIIEKRGIFDAPDIVFEIVSPSTFVMDTITKKEIYEKFKVQEFWLVFPEELVIEVFSFENEKYRLHSHAAESGKTSSKLLKGFEVNLKNVFEEI